MKFLDWLALVWTTGSVGFASGVATAKVARLVARQRALDAELRQRREAAARRSREHADFYDWEQEIKA